MYPSVRISFPVVPIVLSIIFFPVLLVCLPVDNSAAQTLQGTWVLDADASTDIDPWREWRISLLPGDGTITLDRTWRAGRYSQRDSFTVALDTKSIIPIRAGKWMDQVYLGVFVPGNATREVFASLDSYRRQLTVSAVVPLESSQADVTVTISSEYVLTEDGHEMILTEKRSSRSGKPMHYVFKRE